MPRPLVIWSALLIAVVSGLTLWLRIASWPKKSLLDKVEAVAEPRSQQSEKDLTASMAVEFGYVGPKACSQCHKDRVAEFEHTRHYLANSLPDPAKMPEGFSSGRTTCSFPELELQFEMAKSNGEFQQRAIQYSGLRKQLTSSAIGFCYGLAGGADEVYFTWRENQLFELPVAWLSAEKTWGSSPIDRRGHGNFSRETNVRCMECHNTCMDYVAGSRNQYRRDSQILGVTCEVCHGPGRDHVGFHRDHPSVREPHAVVRPALLTRERQIDLCAQCHSNALKHRGPAFRYRPGLVLDDFYYTYQTKYPEEDHVANQTTSMRQSRCFQESDTLTCVTCHNPHQRRSSTNAGVASCAKCHVPSDCHERNRIPTEVQDDCASCHMPELRKIQVFFRTEEDRYVTPVKRYEHRIGIYPEATKKTLLNWYHQQPGTENEEKAAELSANLGEFFRQRTRQYREDYRFQAAIDACRESLKFDPNQVTQNELRELISIQTGIDEGLQDAIWHENERRYDLAIQSFQRILAVKPDHAIAHAKLGTTYAVVQQNQHAIEHLTKAFECDPNDPYAPAMLGWLAYLDGQSDRALKYFAQAEAVEPYSAKINHQMGMALVKLEKNDQAIDRYQKSLEINPRDVNVLLELAQLLGRVNRPLEALKPALQAAKLTQFQDPEIDLKLADFYAAAGNIPDAAATARKALEAAQTRQWRMAPLIQKQLDGYNAQMKKRP